MSGWPLFWKAAPRLGYRAIQRFATADKRNKCSECAHSRLEMDEPIPVSHTAPHLVPPRWACAGQPVDL